MKKQAYEETYQSLLDFKIKQTNAIYKIFSENKAFSEFVAEKLNEDFLAFYKIFFAVHHGKEPIIKPFHLKIISHLQQLELDPLNTKNLILCMPPAYGKSTLIDLFVVWTFGRKPNHMWIYLQGNANNALNRSVVIRSYIENEDSIFNFLFGSELVKGVKNKQKWKFSDCKGQTGFSAGGMQTNITGIDGGNLNINNNAKAIEAADWVQEDILAEDLSKITCGGGIIVDDPLDSADHSAEGVKEKINQHVIHLLTNRLRGSNSKLIIVMQRITDDDPVGHVLQSVYAEDFTILNINGFDETTQKSNWEERHTTAKLQKMKLNNPDSFYSQIQQSPLRKTNSQIIDISKIQYYSDYRDEDLRFTEIFMTTDMAISTKASADYSVVCVWGVIHNYETDQHAVYLLEGWRDRVEMPELIKQIKVLWNMFTSPLHRKKGTTISTCLIEKVSSSISLTQMLEHKGKIDVTQIPRTRDKYERTNLITPYIDQERLYIRESQFSSFLLTECRAFTSQHRYRNDDIVDNVTDAMSYAYDLIT